MSLVVKGKLKVKGKTKVIVKYCENGCRLMSYGKLSFNEFYSCYLQQCFSIDVFFYLTPGCDQKGPMNKVCPSLCFEIFLELAL